MEIFSDFYFLLSVAFMIFIVVNSIIKKRSNDKYAKLLVEEKLEEIHEKHIDSFNRIMNNIIQDKLKVTEEENDEIHSMYYNANVKCNRNFGDYNKMSNKQKYFKLKAAISELEGLYKYDTEMKSFKRSKELEKLLSDNES